MNLNRLRRQPESDCFYTGISETAPPDKQSAASGNYKSVKQFNALRRVLSISKHVALVHQTDWSSGNVCPSTSGKSLMPSAGAVATVMQQELSPTITFDATEDTETVQRHAEGSNNTYVVEPQTPRLYAAGIDPTAREYRAVVFNGLDDTETDPDTGVINLQPISKP